MRPGADDAPREVRSGRRCKDAAHTSRAAGRTACRAWQVSRPAVGQGPEGSSRRRPRGPRRMNAGGYDRASFIAEFYDHVVPYAARADISFYVEAAAKSGGPVLELGCGTGRILIPTARSGIEIAGLELSVGMLEACRRRLQAEPPEVRGRVSLQRGDMRDFDLGRSFRLVTIP